MKLELELVPSSAFFKNLRNSLGLKWGKVSNAVRSHYGYQCQLCLFKGKHSQVHLHETWEYNDETHIQRLKEFKCVCETCHNVIHWGRSQVSGKNMEKLLEHARTVNGCSAHDFKKHVKKSFEIWEERSQHEWLCQFEHYAELIPCGAKSEH